MTDWRMEVDRLADKLSGDAGYPFGAIVAMLLDLLDRYDAEKDLMADQGGDLARLRAENEALRQEVALARDTAFWLNCQWKEPSEAPRSVDTCRLEGTHICALCENATLREKVATLALALERMRGLSFVSLRASNVARCEAVFHPLDAWSLTDWATAAAGELGEACNIIKKMRRAEGSHNPASQNIEPETGWQLLAHELADTVIYVDLLAARARIDLGVAVREKFNLISEKNASLIRLEECAPLPDGAKVLAVVKAATAITWDTDDEEGLHYCSKQEAHALMDAVTALRDDPAWKWDHAVTGHVSDPRDVSYRQARRLPNVFLPEDREP